MPQFSLLNSLRCSARVFTIFLCCLAWTTDSLHAAARLLPLYKPFALSDSVRPELAYGTELWRHAFVVKEEKDDDQPTDENESVDGLVQTGKSDVTSSAAADSLISLIDMSEELLVEESGVSFDMSATEQAAGVECGIALSDWERAACNTHLAGATGTGAKGPSIVTIVVGMVGAIVIFGAYFRSSR